MKDVLLMIQNTCPYCRKALAYMKELESEHPEYRDVAVRIVDEKDDPVLTEALDYWYVPTYFVDGVKVHEGVPDKEKVRLVYERALESHAGDKG